MSAETGNAGLERLCREHGLLAAYLFGSRDPQLASYRNRLTHFYAEITPQELFHVLTAELGDVEAVADELRHAAGRLARAPASD
jgi:hypothetical protein